MGGAMSRYHQQCSTGCLVSKKQVAMKSWVLGDGVPQGQCHAGRLHLVAAMTAAAALLALAPAPHLFAYRSKTSRSRRWFMQMIISVQRQELHV